MNRRLGARPSVRDEPKVPFSAITALAAGKFAFTAGNFTLSAGKASEFIDWTDPAHKIVQATGANQVAAPVAHSDFAGQLCASFTGSQYYVSNQPASRYKYLHDGTGSELLLVYTLTNGATTARMVSTHTATNTGMRLHTTGANGRMYVHNGTIGIIDRTASVTVNTPTYLMAAYSETQSPKSILRLKSATSSSGNPSGSPSSSDPTSTLALGGAAAGIELAQMRWAALIAFPYLDTTQRALVQRWVLQTYGLTP